MNQLGKLETEAIISDRSAKDAIEAKSKTIC